MKHRNELTFFFSFFTRDTVNSVGLIPRRLPFTTSNTVVKTFRHAVALDERRAKFKANLWNRPSNKEQVLSVTDRELKKEADKPKAKKSPNHNGKETLRALENKYNKDKNAATDIDEVINILILTLRVHSIPSFDLGMVCGLPLW